MAVVVQKYGGSSVADVEKIRSIAASIAKRASAGDKIIVVVSAMGDETERLLDLAMAAAAGGIPTAREVDKLIATGETVSSTLMAMAIHSYGCKVVSLSGIQAGITTDNIHSAARIAEVDKERVMAELNAGKVVVVAGFQGSTLDGEVTTLGRGGSDTTAVAMAVIVYAERCEIYTDVEGIYTADPAVVPDARKLNEVDYEDMLEMSILGAKMNPRAVELAAVNNMPVYVASTFANSPGTMIHRMEVSDMPIMELQPKITGVVTESGVAKVSVLGVKHQPGVAAAIITPLAEQGISVDVIVQNTPVQGNADFSFTVAMSAVERCRQILLTESEQSSLTFDRLEVEQGLAKVSIVGTGMLNSAGYASTMFETLGRERINIEMITTSEIRITTLVADTDKAAAARALHAAFGLGSGGT